MCPRSLHNCKLFLPFSGMDVDSSNLAISVKKIYLNWRWLRKEKNHKYLQFQLIKRCFIANFEVRLLFCIQTILLFDNIRLISQSLGLTFFLDAEIPIHWSLFV